MNELTTEDHWDSNWSDYLPKVINPNDSILGINGAFLRSLEKRHKLVNNSSVIELGGACSAYLCALSKFRQLKSSVIDYSHVGLRKTVELFELNDCEVEIFQGNLFNFNFSKSSYNYVVHWGLIEHFNDPSEIFEITHNILKDDGITFFTMPNMDALGKGLWQKYDKEDFNTHVYHSDQNIKEIARKTGFKVESIFYWGPPLYFNAGY